MADLKISGLRQIAADEVNNADVYPLADISASETRKITALDVAKSTVRLIPAGSIPYDKIDKSTIDIPDGSVVTADLADGCVTHEKLAEFDVVDTDQLFDGAVTHEKLSSNQVVDTNQLFDDAVTTDKLANVDVVNTNQIFDEAVTHAKLALTDVVDTNQIFNGSITYEKLYSKDVVNTDQLFDNSVTQDKLAPASCGTLELIDGSITFEKLAATDVVDTNHIFNNAITQEKLDVNSVGAPQILNNAITEDKLSTDSVSTTKVIDLAITTSKLALNACGTPQLANGSVTDLKLADNSVTADKIFSGAVTNSKLSPNSVNTLQLVNNSVTEIKLSGDSVSTPKIIDNAVTNSKLSINSVDTPQVIDGSIAEAKLADGSVTAIKIASEAVTEAKLSTAAFAKGIEKNAVTGLVGLVNDEIVPGLAAGIQYDNFGHITGVTGGVSPDELPLATTSTVGVVLVPPTGGLGVSDIGAISINNTITPSTQTKITYNERGLITGGAALEPADLPKATETTIGGVSIPVDGNLSVIEGAVRMVTSGITPDVSYTKVTCNQFGVITAGGPLTPADVPGLDADAITTGQFGTNRIKDNSITAAKMTDYSTCLMQEDFPGSSDAYYLGMLWWQPSTAQLRVYSRGSAGNQWSPVGFGALQANNLRWGGVFDAATGNVTIVTDFGTTAGLTAGGAIPAPSNDLSGLYLICQTEGSNISQPSVESAAFTPGDWLLCINETEGYIQIDAGATGGGGGGSSYLSTLLDVSLTSLQQGERLEADASGIWSNTSVMDGGTF